MLVLLNLSLQIADHFLRLLVGRRARSCIIIKFIGTSIAIIVDTLSQYCRQLNLAGQRLCLNVGILRRDRWLVLYLLLFNLYLIQVEII